MDVEQKWLPTSSIIYTNYLLVCRLVIGRTGLLCCALLCSHFNQTVTMLSSICFILFYLLLLFLVLSVSLAQMLLGVTIKPFKWTQFSILYIPTAFLRNATEWFVCKRNFYSFDFSYITELMAKSKSRSGKILLHTSYGLICFFHWQSYTVR